MARRFLRWCCLGLLALPLSAESLFTATTLADGTLYSDEVARRIGDLITVRVIERISITDEQETDTSRDNQLSASVNMWPNSSKAPASQGGDNFGTLPAIDLSSGKAFSGEGEYEATQDMTLTLTGRVIDVLDNGNLVIEARRTITHDLETRTIVLSGICRRSDIESGNSVTSSQLHNFEVAVEGDGPLSRAQQEGWLGRLMDILWPF
ncbi:MAG: flagellar basal body L-ring protein FlgH [Planctomycetota bacterium]|jgi:flagellar L-ring protein precursor FlgH